MRSGSYEELQLPLGYVVSLLVLAYALLYHEELPGLQVLHLQNGAEASDSDLPDFCEPLAVDEQLWLSPWD